MFVCTYSIHVNISMTWQISVLAIRKPDMLTIKNKISIIVFCFEKAAIASELLWPASDVPATTLEPSLTWGPGNHGGEVGRLLRLYLCVRGRLTWAAALGARGTRGLMDWSVASYLWRSAGFVRWGTLGFVLHLARSCIGGSTGTGQHVTIVNKDCNKARQRSLTSTFLTRC